MDAAPRLDYRVVMMITANRPVGEYLRDWRQRRRLSQLALALDADVSPRHVSFLETGRARPSREMLLRLAERLEIPLRERNALLVAGGFAPVFPERSLDDPALRAARMAVDLVLTGHEPNPAIAVDRHWHLVAANRAVEPLLAGIEPELLRPPVNVLRLSLHPAGLASRIANLAQWRTHLLGRLRQQVEASADPVLAALLEELRVLPVPGGAGGDGPARDLYETGVVVPMRLRTEHGLLAFFSTTTIFGTPVDITLAELAIESFFPADPATAETLRRIAETWAPRGERARRRPPDGS
jgi:transcriptional regulator with XRE-family HTH domain